MKNHCQLLDFRKAYYIPLVHSCPWSPCLDQLFSRYVYKECWHKTNIHNNTKNAMKAMFNCRISIHLVLNNIHKAISHVVNSIEIWIITLWDIWTSSSVVLFTITVDYHGNTEEFTPLGYSVWRETPPDGSGVGAPGNVYVDAAAISGTIRH